MYSLQPLLDPEMRESSEAAVGDAVEACCGKKIASGASGNKRRKSFCFLDDIPGFRWVVRASIVGAQMSNVPKLHNEAEAAKMLGQSGATLRNWRSKGIGPAFVKIGGSVRTPSSPSSTTSRVASGTRGRTSGLRCSDAEPGA